MKKIKLLLMSCALLGAGTAWADDVYKDVTNTYLTNADFEGEYTVYSNPKSDRAIYQPNGWTVSYTSGDSNDMTALNSSCLQWNSFSSKAQLATGGNNTYWVRLRWGTGAILELSQNVILPEGSYKLTAAYYKNGTGGDGYILVNSTEKNASANEDVWKSLSIEFTSDGVASTKIGCKAKHTAEYEKFLAFDNFVLEWNLTKALTSLIASATEAYNEDTSNTTLKAAIDAANDVKDSQDADVLETAYDNLKTVAALAVNRKAWSDAKSDAEAAYDNSDYANVTGAEKVALATEIGKAEPSDAEGYETAKNALISATSAFTAAKDSYDAYVAAKAEATDVNEADVLAVVIAGNTAATAADALAASVILPKAQTNKNATYAAPVVTNFVVNGTFDSSKDGWTANGGFQNNVLKTSDDSGAGSMNNNKPWWENWNGSAKINKMSQTINNIPNGTYRLDITAFVNNLASETQYVFANSDKTNLTEAKTGVAYEVWTVVTTNSIEIGLEQTTATANWMGIDNVSLNYYGAGDVVNDAKFVAYKSALVDAVAAAAALEGTIPAAAYTALNAVVTENDKTYSTAEGYEAATNAINNAVTSAQVLVAPYAAYKAAAEDAAIAGVASETISAQNTAVEEATTAEAIEACTAVLKSAADSVSGFDITTFTITNPTAQTKDGWEGTKFGGQSDNVCEYWGVSPAGFHQTISLPAGSYRLTVVALQRTNMTGTVYVDDKSTVIAQVANNIVNSRGQAATWFNQGNGLNTVYFTAAEAGDFVIGLKVDETTGDHWTVWKSFKLETFQESIAADYFAPGYATLKESAQTTLNDATYANVTGDEKTALETAIAATPSTVAEYEAAVNAINNAVAAFTAAKTNYDIFATERALADAISTDIVVAAPTSAENALVQFRALKVAEYNYVADAYPYSATPKIGDFKTWDRIGTVNGESKGFTPLTEQHWRGKDMGTYYEQPAGGWSSNANTNWTANYTKTTTLPAGSYVIKVAARAASGTNTVAKITCTAAALDGPIFNFGDTGKGITTAGAASFDEGEFANGGAGRGWVWNYLPFTLDAETEVTMTVVAEATGAYQWFSVCDGELLSKTNIATAVAYNEAVSNTIEDVEVANVTMTRTIKEGFNTVVLPFDLTASQVEAAFGSGTEVYTFSEGSSDPNDVTINFNKVVAGTISANVPVLIKATKASASQVFEGVQVVAPTTEVQVAGNFVTFKGIYAPITVAEGDYFIGNGALCKSKGETNLKAFRAYLDAQGAAGVKMFVGDEEIATGIEEVNGQWSMVNGQSIYNLAGQRLQKMQKGINIVNGKKIMK